MPISLSPTTANRIISINQAVARAEHNFVQTHRPTVRQMLHTPIIYTSPIRQAVYGKSDEMTFYFTIQSLGLSPTLRFADLGSGFGGIAFTAGLHFNEVFGFEIDPRVHLAAEELEKELNFNGNVSVHNMDFMTDDIDLAEFDVLFIFEPFFDNTTGELARRMKDVRPGTTVIHRVSPFHKHEIFPITHFKSRRPTEFFEASGGLPYIYPVSQRI